MKSNHFARFERKCYLLIDFILLSKNVDRLGSKAVLCRLAQARSSIDVAAITAERSNFVDRWPKLNRFALAVAEDFI